MKSRNILINIFFLVISLILAAPIAYIIGYKEHVDAKVTWIICSLLALLILFLIRRSAFYLRIKSFLFDGKLKFYILLILAGFFLFLSLPIQLQPLLHDSRLNLRIIATGQHSPKAHSSEVWIKEIVVSGKKMNLKNIPLAAGWGLKYGKLVSYHDQPNELDYTLTSYPAVVTFLTHPWSGIVRVGVDGRMRTINLYDNVQSFTSINIGYTYTELILLYLAKIGIVYYAILFIGFVYYAVSHYFSKKIKVDGFNRLSIKMIGLVPFISWIFYFMAFYPALMSADSLNQWGQVLSLKINDLNPAFDTIIIWALTRIWNSPAIISLVQITFAAIIYSLGMWRLKRIGVPLSVIWLITVVFSLTPVTGMMFISIWKDIPFSIAVMWVSILLIDIVIQGDTWISRRSNLTNLFVTLLLVSLFRHNGPAILVGLSFILAALYRRYWKRIMIGCIMTFTLFYLITVPFYNALSIKPSPAWLAMSLPISQISAIEASSSPSALGESAILNKILPLNDWVNLYYPYNVTPILYSPYFDGNYINHHLGAFLQVWIKLVYRHPDVAINDWVNLNSIIWQIDQPVGGYTYTTQLGIDPNNLGLQQRTLMPSLRGVLEYVDSFTLRPGVVWMIWRPALYTYLILLIAVVLTIVRKRPYWLISVPIILNSMSLLVASGSQDVRYSLGVFLVLPFIGGLVFSRSEVNKHDNFNLYP